MKIFNLLLFVFFFTMTNAQQQNMSLLANLPIQTMHSTKLNDIWGYTDEFGNEYAIVGTTDGVSIVDISTPTNPVEVFWVSGMNSIWRDIKSYGDYIYVTTEAQEGLLIIDVTSLPNVAGITYTHYLEPSPFAWLSAHNLFIDENGFMYVTGSNYGNGGAIIYDLNTDPINLNRVGVIDDWYAHDCYVQNDTAYFANVYDGYFSIYDMTIKNFPIQLGTSLTPSTFTHNIWADNYGHVYTTDEVSGGYIASFDVTNPASPFLLDKVQSSPGDNVIPHNTHVKGNYLYTSYYVDGVVVHDISRPNNIVQVGRFDTWPGTSNSFDGCWGVYPFFNSGVIIASDYDYGLFIIEDNVAPASYIEGIVTDTITSDPLSNVDVSINGTSILKTTNAFGQYYTGIDSTGTVEVTYSRIMYYPKTITVPVQSGMVTIQDVELRKMPNFSVLVKVYDAQTNQPIENANVSFDYVIDTRATTNLLGEASIDIYYAGIHQISVGKWGYKGVCFSDTLINSSVLLIEVYLEKGYYDDFIFDFGWDTIHTGSKDGWIRDIPLGVSDNNGHIQNPNTDFYTDCNDYCFVTGNSSVSSNASEVNNGEAILFSPVMDLTTYTDPYVNYAIWYFNLYGTYPPDDTLFVYMNNGSQQVLIDYYDPETTPLSQWMTKSVSIADKINITSTMQLILYISDYATSENITEAGIDDFYISEGEVIGVETIEKEIHQNINIFPNPAQNEVNVQTTFTSFKVEIYGLDGQLILSTINQNLIKLEHISRGIYVVKVTDLNTNQIQTKKLVIR